MEFAKAAINTSIENELANRPKRPPTGTDSEPLDGTIQ